MVTLFPSLHLLAPIAWLVLLGFVAAVSFMMYRLLLARDEPSRSAEDSTDVARKDCRYCRRGTAILREETVRFEGDDMIDVRCYVCSGCGLPQWWVGRRRLAPRVR